MSGSTARRRTNRHAKGQVIATLLAVAALVATCGGPAPSMPPGTPAPTLPAASASPTGSPSASPGTTTADWTDVEAAPLARVASFAATKGGAAGAALDTAFTLTSLDGSDPAALAARIVADPPVELRVGAASGETVALRPARPLVAGQLYRFTLRGSDPTTTEASWAIQAAHPLQVATTIPYGDATGVPLNTGIEITFDQPGVALDDVRRHVGIEPAVAGHFEREGRTVAFVPDRPLRRSTLYTITVARGIALPGTGMRLEEDFVLRFETRGKAESSVRMTLARTLFDASTSERPVLTVHLDSEDEDQQVEAVRSLQVTVHRLPDIAAAIAAHRLIDAAPDWTRVTSTAPVKTAGLPRVLSGRVSVNTEGYPRWVRLPRRLPAGWYVVTATHGGIARQAILQVTDLAAYAQVTTGRSAVWVNDLRSDDPVRGASVTLAGRSLGRTDADGLLVARTPPSVVRAGDAIDTTLVVRKGARAAFVPLGRDWVCAKCEDPWWWEQSDQDNWWQAFATDRYSYRTTDTINAWGVVRARDGGDVPGRVTVELLIQDWASELRSSGAPIASATATPDRTGSFAARLPFKDLPSGDYTVRVRVGESIVAGASLTVGPIVKPSWAMSVATDRRAVIAGATVTASVDAAFFEGTPVVGAELRAGGGDDEDGEEPSVLTRTDELGHATATLPMSLADDDAQWQVRSLWLRPTAPEEAELGASAQVMVFRASALVSAEGVIDGKRLAVKGTVRSVAFERFASADPADFWDIEPAGAARAGARVRVHVTEIIPILTQTGTYYDWVTKRTRPEYEISERRVNLGSRTATTGADGAYRVAMTVDGGDRSYEILASYTDEAGRVTHERTWAQAAVRYDEESNMPYLASVEPRSRDDYRVGEQVRVEFRHGAEDVPVSRYLYVVSRLGLQSAVVSDRARFATRFDAADVPSLYIGAVRFNGTGYEVAQDYYASFAASERRLGVELTADRASYRPGERATVDVRTTGPDGRPVAASVYVRVIDERLYAIGGAGDTDPLDELYRAVGSGRIVAGWTHRDPTRAGDEGGDTGGGGAYGGRSDFRDWLAAELVTTDATGRGSLSVDLSDDLTSWRVVGQAVDRRLEAGTGTGRIVVTLPLFVEATLAPEYLAADRPVIRLRAYGTGLSTGDLVTFRVSSETLSMAEVSASANAFETVEVPLPALRVGEQRIRIRATSGSGSASREDILVRTFRVVDTRTIRRTTTSALLTGPTGVAGGASGFTTLTLLDAGRGRVVPLLESLVWASPDRADRAVAASLAAAVLRDDFGIEPEAVPSETDLSRFRREGGYGIVPWAGADLELSVLLALSRDPAVDRDALRWYFENGDEEGEEEIVETRERALWRLAGRAAVGEPVLAEVREAATASDLGATERLVLALAALAAGDEALAAELEHGLLDAYGQRFGPWVRVHGAGDLDDGVATARLAIVAASLGDPIAVDMDAYLEANVPERTVVDLERVIAARGWAARVPGSAARAAVTIDGRREEVRIDPARPLRYTLTPAQAASARLERLDGSVLLSTSLEAPLDAAALTAPDGLGLRREVTPAGTIGATDTVVVTLHVTLPSDPADGCWSVVEFAPSGLAPIHPWAEYGYDDEEEGPGYEGPWRVDGQRLDFCASRGSEPSLTLRYLARVVTPGTYRWEPAVLQSSVAPELGMVTEASTVTISGLEG